MSDVVLARGGAGVSLFDGLARRVHSGLCLQGNKKILQELTVALMQKYSVRPKLKHPYQTSDVVVVV